MPEYSIYPYVIVHFIHDVNDDKTRSIEFVPSSWVDFDQANGCLVSKYMEAPYSEEDKKLIRDLINAEMAAPESWPNFEVKSVGRARTFIDKNYLFTYSPLLYRHYYCRYIFFAL